MNILIYNISHLFIFPFFLFFFGFRFLFKKENVNSFLQKLLSAGSVNNYDYIIHVASIGELNSINFIIKEIFTNKKILITCSTLSSYQLAINKYAQFKIQYLPYDFYPLVNIFLTKNKTDKFIWIDSEIWPNYLYALRARNIKTYLINARISEKSFVRWKLASTFIKDLGSVYKDIYASSLGDKKKFEILLKRKVFFCENLKFYQKLNILTKNKKNLCFASVHLQEYGDIAKIISKIKLNNIDKIYIIPRHPQYISILSNELSKNNVSSEKIIVLNEIGKNKEIYSISKVTFMGGSLFIHGGQNPLEALSCGSYILTGPHISNFSSIYNELESQKLCGVFKEIDHNLISNLIDKIMNETELLDINKIEYLFNKKIKKLREITNKISND